MCPAGAAIEARILAEDSQTGFLPSTGQVMYLKEPGGIPGYGSTRPCTRA